MVSRVKTIDEQILEVEAQLAEVRSRLPAHSLKVSMAMEIDELEDKLDQLRAQKMREEEAAKAMGSTGQNPAFDYTVESSKGFDAAVDAVTQATAANGFRVQHIHDVQATLAEKGLTREPMKIIEVCNAKYAHQMLQVDPLISLMMPCRVTVYVQDGKTLVSTMRPSAIAGFFPGRDLGDVPQQVEKTLLAIVDAAR